MDQLGFVLHNELHVKQRESASTIALTLLAHLPFAILLALTLITALLLALALLTSHARRL